MCEIGIRGSGRASWTGVVSSECLQPEGLTKFMVLHLFEHCMSPSAVEKTEQIQARSRQC